MSIGLLTTLVMFSATLIVALHQFKAFGKTGRSARWLSKARSFVVRHAAKIFGSGSTIMVIQIWRKTIDTREVPWGYVWFWTIFWIVASMLMVGFVRYLKRRKRIEVGQMFCRALGTSYRCADFFSDDSLSTVFWVCLFVLCLSMTVLQGIPNWGPDLPEVTNFTTRMAQRIWHSSPVENVAGTIKLFFGDGGRIPFVERGLGLDVPPQVSQEAYQPIELLQPRYQKTWLWFIGLFVCPLLALISFFRASLDDIGEKLAIGWARVFGKDETAVASSTKEPSTLSSTAPAPTPNGETAPAPMSFFQRVLDEIVGGVIVRAGEKIAQAAKKVT